MPDLERALEALTEKGGSKVRARLLVQRSLDQLRGTMPAPEPERPFGKPVDPQELLGGRQGDWVVPIRPENRARYPEDWDHISDMVRFGRAGARCECLGECGILHLEFNAAGGEGRASRCAAVHCELHPITGARVILTTGHLDHQPEHSDNPGGVFVELALEDSNLRAWCQRCHNNYDREERSANAAATREKRSGQLRLM